MNPQAPAPNPPTHTVTTTVLVGGSNVTQNPGGLLSASVYRDLNKIPTARLIFQDGTVESQTFQKSDGPTFVPGKAVDVQVGYQTNESSVFRGIIVRHSVRIQPGRPSVLELDCKDEAVKMTLIRHSRYFYNLTDTDVFRQLIGHYPSLTVGDLATTNPVHEELVQHQATDWDFLVLRAEANGLVVWVDDGKVHIVKPTVGPRADVQATNGQNIIEFEANLDGRTHWPAVRATTWDYTTQTLTHEDTQAAAGGNNFFASDFYGTAPMPFYHGGDLATEALQAWAEGRQTKSNLSRMQGRVRMRGSAIRPLQTLVLQHVGDRFNGNYLVTGVMHQIYGGTWLVDVQLGMTVTDFAASPAQIETPAAAGLMAGVRGLHLGVVTKLAGDTRAGNHRIQVRIPYLALTDTADSSQQTDGIWARLGTLHAGDGRGSVFRPEIGDEVVLGFINDDPNDAIVLGAVHSNKHPAPTDATDKNFQKGYWAKAGMRLVFDDDERSLTLDTKEGYAISLNEKTGELRLKDKFKNSLVLDKNGITLDSATNITIKAATNVKITGGTRIDLN